MGARWREATHAQTARAKLGQDRHQRHPLIAGGAASATASTGLAARTMLHSPRKQQPNQTACRWRNGRTVAGGNMHAGKWLGQNRGKIGVSGPL